MKIFKEAILAALQENVAPGRTWGKAGSLFQLIFENILTVPCRNLQKLKKNQILLKLQYK